MSEISRNIILSDIGELYYIDGKTRKTRSSDEESCERATLEPLLNVKFSKVYASILGVLASEPGRVFSSRELVSAVWPGYPMSGDSRILTTNIGRVRTRLAELGAGMENYLKTVSWFGYSWSEEAFYPIDCHSTGEIPQADMQQIPGLLQRHIRVDRSLAPSLNQSNLNISVE